MLFFFFLQNYILIIKGFSYLTDKLVKKISHSLLIIYSLILMGLKWCLDHRLKKLYRRYRQIK